MGNDDRKYWMVRLGRGGAYAEELMISGEIGVDFIEDVDLTPFLSSTPRPFREAVLPLFRKREPNKSKIGAGLAVGNLWVATCGIFKGDRVLSPLGHGRYAVGEVTGSYRYIPGTVAPHRRAVQWDAAPIDKESMSPELRSAMVPAMTVYNIDSYGGEIEALRSGGGDTLRTIGTETTTIDAVVIEQLVAFQMEKQLEDFLVQNWANTTLGREYDIYSDENGTGQQYQTDTGPLDILAISKDKKRLLVVELKRGKPSDDVVGQVLRYMGWAKRELLEPGQMVEGLIIALHDDLRVQNALSMVDNVRFMTYSVRFDLTSL